MTSRKSNLFSKVRIFLACTGDLEEERSRMLVIVGGLESLATELGLVLELVDWHKVIPEMGRPQQVIFDQLMPETWDIFIGVLWHRFGTRPGKNDEVNNKEYQSGTEEEFKTVYELWKKYKRPHILLYRSKRPIDPDKIDSDQLKLVNAFINNFAADGEHPGLYQPYDSLETFARLVQDNIVKLIVAIGKNISEERVEELIPTIINTLPRRNTFVGRNNEIKKSLTALESSVRGWGLVIDGIGGIGKTSLATEVAHICKDRNFFDAYVFVTAKRDRLETTGISEITLSETTLEGIINELGRAMGSPGIAQLADIKNKQREVLYLLRDKKALVIFDNLETLTTGEQNSIGDFLLNLPQNCKAIVTTRQHSFTSALTLRLNKLKWEEGKELIENQIKQFGDDLNILKKEGEEGWKKLYDEAGGSPLALIYITGLMRVRRLSFEKTLKLLRDGSTKNNLIEFIYREAKSSMDENECTVLQAISLFGGPASFEAVMSVADINRQALDTVLDKLRALGLVDTVSNESDINTSDQYTLHPLTQRFARGDLSENKIKENSLKIQYCKYWYSYTRKFTGNSKESKNYDKLELEWKNISTAINLLEAATNEKNSKKDGQLLIDFIQELNFFLWRFGRWDELLQFNSRAFELRYTSGDLRQAGGFAYFIARTHYFRGSIEDSKEWTEKCFKAWSSSGAEAIEQAYALRLKGLIAFHIKDYKLATKMITEALNIWEQSRYNRGSIVGFNELAQIKMQEKNYEEAEKYYIKALAIAKKLKLEDAIIYTTVNLGNLYLDNNEFTRAKPLFENALERATLLGQNDLIAQAKFGLSRQLYKEGDPEKAKVLIKDAIVIYKKIQHKDLLNAESFNSKIK